MIIAMLHPNGVCHTILDNKKFTDESMIPSHSVVISDYDYAYLDSHYSRESGEWTYYPVGEQMVWDDKTNMFVEMPKEGDSLPEEPPTEESTEE